MEIDEIKKMIENGIPGSIVTVDGDGTHFQAIVVSGGFSGKTMLQQHQMVYRTLGNKIGKEIHALSLQTYTPEQWDEQKGLRVI
ncbi:MAG: BolA/IbaG family iron-sulfur metabolism protein [Gammaproteobacteria bacterium]|nr:BolA/IbaG family iron-sulfur metabolism protein [Gammaproteobacteria bacterium]